MTPRRCPYCDAALDPQERCDCGCLGAEKVRDFAAPNFTATRNRRKPSKTFINAIVAQTIAEIKRNVAAQISEERKHTTAVDSRSFAALRMTHTAQGDTGRIDL